MYRGLCNAGIVGENVLCEKAIEAKQKKYQALSRLEACACRLSIAVPLQFDWQGAVSLNGKRIALKFLSHTEKVTGWARWFAPA